MKKQKIKKQKYQFQDLLYKHVTRDRIDVALDSAGHVRVGEKVSPYVSLVKQER